VFIKIFKLIDLFLLIILQNQNGVMRCPSWLHILKIAGSFVAGDVGPFGSRELGHLRAVAGKMADLDK